MEPFIVPNAWLPIAQPALDHNVWHCSISLPTKLRPYWVFILLVILCGGETWSPIWQLTRNLNAFDQWCLWHVLHMSWMACSMNEEVVLISHHSHTSSVPPALSSSITLRVSIHLWTTDEPVQPVWPLSQGTGTADRADHITPGSALLNPI